MTTGTWMSRNNPKPKRVTIIQTTEVIIMSNKETVEQYLARGGQVSTHKKANATNGWEFMKKDTKLRELRKLYHQVRDNEEQAALVQAEIDKRVQLLKP